MRTTPLVALLLAACASPPYSTHEAASIHAPMAYSCEDRLSLSFRFARDGAHVTLPSGEQVFLPQQNADGSYNSSQHQYQGADDSGNWQVGPRVPAACRVQR